MPWYYVSSSIHQHLSLLKPGVKKSESPKPMTNGPYKFHTHTLHPGDECAGRKTLWVQRKAGEKLQIQAKPLQPIELASKWTIKKINGLLLTGVRMQASAHSYFLLSISAA